MADTGIEFEECKACGEGQDVCTCDGTIQIKDGTVLVAVGAIVWYMEINQVRIAYYNKNQEYRVKILDNVARIVFSQGLKFENFEVTSKQLNILFKKDTSVPNAVVDGYVEFSINNHGQWVLTVSHEEHTLWK